MIAIPFIIFLFIAYKTIESNAAVVTSRRTRSETIRNGGEITPEANTEYDQLVKHQQGFSTVGLIICLFQFLYQSVFVPVFMSASVPVSGTNDYSSWWSWTAMVTLECSFCCLFYGAVVKFTEMVEILPEMVRWVSTRSEFLPDSLLEKGLSKGWQGMISLAHFITSIEYAEHAERARHFIVTHVNTLRNKSTAATKITPVVTPVIASADSLSSTSSAAESIATPLNVSTIEEKDESEEKETTTVASSSILTSSASSSDMAVNESSED